jgi:diguanylate cyclase (GGDEF)-like protein
MNSVHKRNALRVASIYFLFSSVWIFGSDYILSLFVADIESYHFIQTIKGISFIILSSLIIYYLVEIELKYNRKANIDLDHLRQYDQLTGVHNRDSFNKEVERLAISRESVSIIITDINGLKIINEVYSSLKGDDVLRRYSKLVRELLPRNAFFARIGGDEFCAIIPKCSFDEARKLSDQLLEQAENEKIEDFDLSISIGFSTVGINGVSILEGTQLAEDRMLQNKLLKSESASNSIISSIKSTLFERSDETEQHAERIAIYCERIGKEMDLPMASINELKLLALLHDIGKIGVADSVLKKEGPLTTSEYNRMKLHSEIGYKMASSIRHLESISYFILTHHEKWNGTGYPKGLKGREIPIQSRILAVADAYDAMTNDRIYRKAMSKEEALIELQSNSGTQFDPYIIDIFLKILKNKTSNLI